MDSNACWKQKNNRQNRSDTQREVLDVNRMQPYAQCRLILDHSVLSYQCYGRMTLNDNPLLARLTVVCITHI